MENGTFQNLNLSHLDFSDFEERSLPPIQRADKHQIINFTEIPKDIRKSGTVETLISQNEDLMARLKVTLRRLTILEDENKSIHSQFEEMKTTYSSVSDQMLIWKEKEKIWKERNEKANSELEAIKARLPDYAKLEAQVERYKRYQEKVKTTIKPYLQQLKDYAATLHLQIQNMNRDLDRRDAEIHDLNQQLLANKEALTQKIHFYESNQIQLVNTFEKDKLELFHQIQVLNESNQALEAKSQNLDRSLERQDELENLIIALRRSKDDFQQSTQREIDDLRNQNRELKQFLTEKTMSSQDLASEKEKLKGENHLLQSRQSELEEQLTSLRYMWNSKSEENEKLKITISSLEKINLELSQKLNESRKQS